MDFFCKTDIEASSFSLNHEGKVMLVGSCFADEMGRRLMRDKFRVRTNPFGVLYNPMSIAAHLLRCVSLPDYASKDHELFEDTNQSRWLSWMHASEFSASNREDLVALLNATQQTASEWLRTCSILIVTLGTAMVYRLKDTDMLVANCHKQPDALFKRSRLSAYDIVDAWRPVLQLLRSVNPTLKVVFTVSPIRHKRDGLHGNNLSKAELLLACDALCEEEGVGYFPSYELLVDELRDYRFYAPDMVHPTEQAADYIYERFTTTYVSREEQRISERCRRVALALGHRPFHAESKEYRDFLESQLSEIEALHKMCPTVDFAEELALCQARLRG